MDKQDKTHAFSVDVRRPTLPAGKIPFQIVFAVSVTFASSAEALRHCTRGSYSLSRAGVNSGGLDRCAGDRFGNAKTTGGDDVR